MVKTETYLITFKVSSFKAYESIIFKCKKVIRHRAFGKTKTEITTLFSLN